RFPSTPRGLLVFGLAQLLFDARASFTDAFP
ncbi:MAG: hypothetical protein ACI855_004935, partial [Myxococcota bacterium]